MRIGLLGAGRIGAAHAEVLHAHPDVSELVIADADTTRAQSVVERLGPGASSVDSVDDVLAANVDALVIATPTSSHADLICRGVEAGLPVFCEKPVAADLKRTVEVVAQIAQAGAVVQIGFQRRFDAGYRAAREALRSGALGTLHRMHLVTADPAPPPPEYIPHSGGIFRDCHIHDFDIALWLTGQPVVEVYATGANRGASFFADAGDVDTSVALLTFADGTLATVQGSRYNGGGYDVRMELAGTRRTQAVGLGPRAPLHSTEQPETGAEPWPDFVTRFEAAYRAEIDAFLTGESSPCTIEDALEALYVAEAADLSLREGRPVEVAEVRR